LFFSLRPSACCCFVTEEFFPRPQSLYFNSHVEHPILPPYNTCLDPAHFQHPFSPSFTLPLSLTSRTAAPPATPVHLHDHSTLVIPRFPCHTISVPQPWCPSRFRLTVPVLCFLYDCLMRSFPLRAPTVIRQSDGFVPFLWICILMAAFPF